MCVHFRFLSFTPIQGIDVESHKEYLETFCDHFHDSIIDLVDAAVEKSQRMSSDAVFSEVLQHLHAANNSCKIFQVSIIVVVRIFRDTSE